MRFFFLVLATMMKFERAWCISAPSVGRVEIEAAFSSRDLLVWFPNVRNIVEEGDDLDTFKNLTRDFLQQEGGFALDAIVVLDQTIETINNLPLANAILIQSGEDILDAYLAKTIGLAIQIRVDAGKDTANVIALLTNNWDAYVAFLGSGGLQQLTYTQATYAAPPKEQPVAVERSSNFALVFSVLVFSLAAIAVVAFSRRSGRRRHRLASEQTVAGTAQHPNLNIDGQAHLSGRSLRRLDFSSN